MGFPSFVYYFCLNFRHIVKICNTRILDFVNTVVFLPTEMLYFFFFGLDNLSAPRDMNKQCKW